MTLMPAFPAVAAAFLGSLVEAAEALTIVLAVATVRGWRPAGLGALAGLVLLALIVLGLGALLACALVMAAGLALHRPLARLPENTLKFAVGVMLSAFGVFWTGEGLGVSWPGADLAILGFSALFLIVAVAAVGLARRRAAE